MCTIGHLPILGVAASVAYTTTLKPQWMALARDANAFGDSDVFSSWSIRWHAHRPPDGRKVEWKSQDLRLLFTPQRSEHRMQPVAVGSVYSSCQTHAHPEFPQRKIFEVFECERELIPYAAFDGFRSSQVRVSTCLVRFDNNSYSVSGAGGRMPNGW